MGGCLSQHCNYETVPLDDEEDTLLPPLSACQYDGAFAIDADTEGSEGGEESEGGEGSEGGEESEGGEGNEKSEGGEESEESVEFEVVEPPPSIPRRRSWWRRR